MTGRYDRHLRLAGFTAAAQERIAAARVAVVGAGGLGSPVLLYLAGAGVGSLDIIDFDRVAADNLPRQILFTEADLGKAKASAAARTLAARNGEVRVRGLCLRLSADNAQDLLCSHDVVVDATDGFANKLLLNDTCVRLGIPLVHGGVLGYNGQVAVFSPPRGPCLRCLIGSTRAEGEVSPDAASTGVFGPATGLLGCLQAAETLKLLTGIGDVLIGSMLVIDAAFMEMRKVRIDADPECPACGSRSSATPPPA